MSIFTFNGNEPIEINLIVDAIKSLGVSCIFGFNHFENAYFFSVDRNEKYPATIIDLTSNGLISFKDYDENGEADLPTRLKVNSYEQAIQVITDHLKSSDCKLDIK